jgi:hypothetical protein
MTINHSGAGEGQMRTFADATADEAFELSAP